MPAQHFAVLKTPMLPSVTDPGRQCLFCQVSLQDSRAHQNSNTMLPLKAHVVPTTNKETPRRPLGSDPTKRQKKIKETTSRRPKCFSPKSWWHSGPSNRDRTTKMGRLYLGVLARMPERGQNACPGRTPVGGQYAFSRILAGIQIFRIKGGPCNYRNLQQVRLAAAQIPCK